MLGFFRTCVVFVSSFVGFAYTRFQIEDHAEHGSLMV